MIIVYTKSAKLRYQRYVKHIFFSSLPVIRALASYSLLSLMIAVYSLTKSFTQKIENMIVIPLCL